MTSDGSTLATRHLRDVLEPLAGCVYFAPETHAAFEALGYGPSAGDFGGVAAPNGVAYFTSRGGCMGQVSGETVAAAFGVFSPAVVVPAVEEGWRIASRDDLLSARCQGTTAFLTKALAGIGPDHIERTTILLLRAADGAEVAGRPLYSGLKSLGLPGDAIGDLWRVADLVREHRGDCHIAAWTTAGLSAPEIMLLTELWWGIPRRTYALTRGWTTGEYDAADERLMADGLIADDRLTDSGRRLRRDIEDSTDRQERRVIDALDGDLQELIELLTPIAAAIHDHQGYPRLAFRTASDIEESA